MLLTYRSLLLGSIYILQSIYIYKSINGVSAFCLSHEALTHVV